MTDDIKFVVGKKFEPVAVQKGLYRAKITEIRDLTISDRDTWAISFRLEEGPAMGKTIDGLCSPILSEKSKLNAWVQAITGIKAGPETIIRKSDLIGKTCRVFTDDKTSEKFGLTSFVKDVVAA